MLGRKRLLLLTLAVLCVLVLVRLLNESPPPRGVAILEDIEPASLSVREFEAFDDISVVVSATGSLDQRQNAEGLAAKGWILDQESREVVWHMDRSVLVPGRGSLVHTEGDTLRLKAGRYRVYFSSLGQILSRVNGPFRKEHRHWRVEIKGLQGASLNLMSGVIAVRDSSVLWSAAPLENNEKREFIFEVRDAVELDVYAVGQITAAEGVIRSDYAWIEQVGAAQHVWSMSLNNTDWAGGIDANRAFRGQVELRPGVYRAVAQTDRRHAFGNWVGNPPADPYAWGLTLRCKDMNSIAAFDPWGTRSPITSFTRVVDDEKWKQTFEVTEPVAVAIYAMGELTGPSNDYDYAWLDELIPDGEPRRVWSMQYENTLHAGGGWKNRKETVFLQLDPGQYALSYTSDGSHSYGSWNADGPAHPERWGVSLFSVEANLPEGRIRMLERTDL